MSGDAPNNPIYHSAEHAVIWRRRNDMWPYLVVRLTDGSEHEFGDARGALVWVEGVASVQELPGRVRRLLKFLEGGV